MLLTVDYFGRLIVDCTYKCVSPLSIAWPVIIVVLLIYNPSISEVDDLDIEVLIKHDVLWLQVSMHDPLLLQILGKVDQLGENDLNGLLRQVALGHLDQVIQGAI